MFKINILIFAALLACWLDQHSKQNFDFNKKTAPVSETVDGPYVLYRNDSVFVNYLETNGTEMTVRKDSIPVSLKDNLKLEVKTDIPGKTFTVQLKPKHSV